MVAKILNFRPVCSTHPLLPNQMEEHLSSTTLYTAVVATLGFLGVIFQGVMSYVKEGRERAWKIEDRKYQDEQRKLAEMAAKEAAEVAAAAAKEAAVIVARSNNLVVNKIEDSKKTRAKEKDEIVAAVSEVKEQSQKAFEAANNTHQRVADSEIKANEAIGAATQALALASGAKPEEVKA